MNPNANIAAITMLTSVCTVMCVASLSAESVPVPGWTDVAAEKIRPMKDNVAAVMLAPGRFSLSADFSVLKADRASWDIPIRLDLQRKSGIAFDFFCSGLEVSSGLNIYLKSGNGWYTGRLASPDQPGWHRIEVLKSAFVRTEGEVAGWRNVDTLRLSAWRCGKGKVTLGIGNMAFIDDGPALIGVVQADSCANNPKYGSERKNFATFANRTFLAFKEAGVKTALISDVELDAGAVEGLKLLVFPYNPSLPKDKVQTVRDFVNAGGKLFACHSTDPEVRKLLGLDEKLYKSRNWSSSSETPSAERNGFYLQHVWRYQPEDSRRQAYELLMRVDPAFKADLEKTRRANEQKAREDAAWIAQQPSKEGEWRAFWCHSARGIKGRTWDESIRLLKENGFNAILPNLAWGGYAFYKSSVATEDPSVATDGDALVQCLAACRKYGVECHVWKVCWKTKSDMDKKTLDRFRADGRLQKDADGKEEKWLCPSRPENRTLEADAFLEIAKSGVDGVHFDYIRYSNARHCFCDHCRTSFEKRIGRAVVDWPKDIVGEKDAALVAAWRKFRCDNITALVREVSNRVRREAPGVKLSAAVFPNPNRDPDVIGQDWPAWCRDGLLDFVCPMDYSGALRSLVAAQKRALDGTSVKLRPGLGLSCWEDARNDGLELTRQIGIVRDLGLDGFTVFNLDPRAAAVLPILHTGPTKSTN